MYCGPKYRCNRLNILGARTRGLGVRFAIVWDMVLVVRDGAGGGDVCYGSLRESG